MYLVVCAGCNAHVLRSVLLWYYLFETSPKQRHTHEERESHENNTITKTKTYLRHYNTTGASPKHDRDIPSRLRHFQDRTGDLPQVLGVLFKSVWFTDPDWPVESTRCARAKNPPTYPQQIAGVLSKDTRHAPPKYRFILF